MRQRSLGKALAMLTLAAMLAACAGTPQSDSVLARQAHIAKTRKLVERITEQNEQKRQAASFGRTPTPNGAKPSNDEARREQSSIYRSTF